MTPFRRITEIAAPIEIANVDTDMLFPAAFLKTVSRDGLAEALFYNLRQSDAGFVLDTAPWTQAGILVALDNFGCGSSREHAPWALVDFGVRCVIAPSFADIFLSNCFKNGILPIQLSHADVDDLMADARSPSTARMTVDLEAQTITRSGGDRIAFVTDPQRRRRLLDGIDDIAHSVAFLESILGHERRSESVQPWLKPIPEELP